MSLIGRAVVSSVVGLAVLGLLLFVSAGTVHYWQAWVLLAVFTLASGLPTGYLARRDPAALARRMHAGPRAETRTPQRIVIAVIFACFPAQFVLSALDHRFGWSPVPAAVCAFGDVLVALGLLLAMLVIAQNSYAAATVTIEAGQPLVTTGLYALVRHPMYTGNVILMAGIPLALGSYWGLLFLIPGLIVLIVRIGDEEAMLRQGLPGYRQYCATVRYRLLPGVW